ncbi:MAG TPA: DUF3500 domain-containing protein [Chloroflexota bacterium]|nr:DUF3500 domain-containing protein [Chloroflexota bacterium]
MKDWTEFEVRGGPELSARTRVVGVPPFQEMIDTILAECRAASEAPLRGVTADGRTVPGLFRAKGGAVDTDPLREAALAFLEALEPADRPNATLPLDAVERRQWSNIHPNFFRHGVMLEGLPAAQRERGLQLLRATLSARGFAQGRDIMRLNGLLATISGSGEQFGEWPYFLTIFGTPSATAPWGWQFDGHHLNVNCFVLGDALVITPTFMGSEPCKVTAGALAGTEVFAVEQQAGIDLIRSLDAAQHGAAVLYPSIMPGTLPKHLEHWIDHRMQAGAFKDNAVLPYQGLRADALTDIQRTLLRKAAGVYLGWARDDHAAVRTAEVDAHLDETWFSWLGGTGDTDPFYYRIHSPVVLIEFDHHPGAAFDNDEPSRHHVHTILRTPNGGDYGADLLARHHDEFDHSHGDHR